MTVPAELISQHWDVIVVGAGMGGATLGYALARAGKRVLFCEQGRSYLSDPQALTGDYAETFFPRPEPAGLKHQEQMSHAGRYWGELEDQSLARTVKFVPFVGAGTGGSSALYGMALERFFPSDFTPARNYSYAAQTTLPQAWPISYAELAPYYQAAETLFRVRGSADPLRGETPTHLLSPPTLSPGAQQLHDFLRTHGMHPYRLPMACEYVTGCQCCQGYLCPKRCKNDAARICLEPAIANHEARLLDQCSVLKLEATADAVTGIVCMRRGERIVLRAAHVVLAAGALETPRILLDSASQAWPDGLANDSGLVGKNLMRHHVDLYVLKSPIPGLLDNRHKELAFNDFYHADGTKLGSVQSFGRLPPAPLLVESMQQELRDAGRSWAAALLKPAKPLLRKVLGRMANQSLVLASIVEDLPYADNRIAPLGSDGKLGLRYRIRPQDQIRIDRLRGLMAQMLKSYRVRIVKQAENNQRLAHVCGTCRFGDDPANSVLNRENRAHGVTNLYIVDSSFFPSSGGTNPSLTIAANALRVAEAMLRNTNRHHEGGHLA